MNRRSFLTNVTTGGALGSTGCLDRLEEGDEVPPDTLDAVGSTAGSVTVPPSDRVFFATWCVPCKLQMEHLSTVLPDSTSTLY